MRQDSSKLDLTGTGYCASFNFRRTARAVTQLYDAALQESGIRSTQFAILVGIAKNQPVSIGALATNTDTANHPLIRHNFPLLTQAIVAGARECPHRRRPRSPAATLRRRCGTRR